MFNRPEPEPREPESSRRGDGVLALCLLALIAVVVVGGLLALFAWVTTSLPDTQLLECQSFAGCATEVPEAQEALPAAPVEPGTHPGLPLFDEPKMAP